MCVEARSWLNTPFHENACIKGVGVDCGRFLVKAFEAAGIEVPGLEELPNFAHGWFLNKSDERYFSIIARFARPVPHPRPADIVMYKIGRAWAHSAILLEHPTVIHALQPSVQLANLNHIPRMGKDRLFLSPWAK